MGGAASKTGFAVDIRGASLSYGGVPLFDGLDIRLETGVWTCLLGPSGVGKSSLLRLIAGLGGGAAGRVRTAPVAYMSQDDLLLPWASVLDNAVLGARLRGERPDFDRARLLLRQVGLAESLPARPASLSGGERQRVALVRTLMEDRPVVLMDEPFGSLDAITRHRAQDLAARLLAGRTVLLVTHDPLEALRLGRRIYVMTGRPAVLEALPAPGPAPPRDARDPAVLAAQGALLARLAA